MDLKRYLIDNTKNLLGWKTERKIVVFSVDDYGNVRLDSKTAKENMEKAGVKTSSRFDAYDTLESREDLEILFEVLVSVKDKNDRNAVFTPLALPCNINFERMAEEGNQHYIYELLPLTYDKLSSLHPNDYRGTWSLWLEGIEKGLMLPQFHGREHFNLKVFEEKLAKKDHEVITAIRNRSYTNISNSGYSTIGITAAFGFWDFKENERFEEIIIDGLNAFKKVYNYQAEYFTAPGASEHHVIHKTLKDHGIKYLDTPFIKLEHQGFGKYKRKINYTGKVNPEGNVYLVRNVVFEPADDKINDWVNYTLKQIEIAFLHKKPAIISSHRVNFCGVIDSKNREKGIVALKELLQQITRKWPDVEMMSAGELAAIISN
jgi:hypothetical protein